jgi:molybdate transport system permease protein
MAAGSGVPAVNEIHVLSVPAPLMLTLKVCSVATLFAFFVGIGAAFFMARARFRGKELLDAALALPLVLPPTVLGYYLIVILGRNGLVGAWLRRTFGISLMFTWQGAALAAAIVSMPLVYKAARTAFAGVDRNLEKAARTLGLSEVAVFLRVSFPLAWRGVLAGTLLAFARAVGEFGATLMVAGNLPEKTQTLSLAIYDAVQSGNDRQAGLLVVVTSVFCVGILVFSGKILNTPYLRETDR